MKKTLLFSFLFLFLASTAFAQPEITATLEPTLSATLTPTPVPTAAPVSYEEVLDVIYTLFPEFRKSIEPFVNLFLAVLTTLLFLLGGVAAMVVYLYKNNLIESRSHVVFAIQVIALLAKLTPSKEDDKQIQDLLDQLKENK